MPNSTQSPLFRALERCFRTVKVDSEQENYSVNCPFCGDRRSRLSLHHSWGTSRNGSKLDLRLACCFNEDCLNPPGRRQELFDLLFPLAGRIGTGARRSPPGDSGRASPPAIKKVSELPPGDYLPLHRLKPFDEARLYLERRGFNCEQLESARGVIYCQFAPDSKPNIADRLVIPYFDPPAPWDHSLGRKNELVGYIARRPSEDMPFHRGLEQKKYLLPTGFSKGSFLYGLERAAETIGPLVICEGVTDVWRVGDNAVALTGKTMSRMQEQLVLSRFAGRTLLIGLDSDAQEQALAIQERLQAARELDSDPAEVRLLTLPAGRKDLGECSREEMSAILHRNED